MNHPLPDKVQKYLSKYGDPSWNLNHKGEEKYNCAVVIPAIAEYENIISLLHSLSENLFESTNKVIIIFVVNNLNSSSQDVKDDNYKSLQLLNAISNNKSSFHPVVNKINSSGLHLGFVDASTEGLEMPEKTGGVGLARKLGMDFALTIFDYDKMGKKVLVCLDADCTVQDNYIQEIIDYYNYNNANAAVINYEHLLVGNEENIKAIICYELFLRYYELGLKYAGSEYSFQTVGSTMTCDYESYIKIEGMNKQKAAEDFYFLEKLTKHYKIDKINSTTVFPSARKSWRVPFGTGQRMNRYFSKTHDEYLLYNPKGFTVLKKWLLVFYSEKKFSGEEYLHLAKDIHPELLSFLKEQNFLESWDKILSNSKNSNQIKIQKHRWFDGFKTLKLIHHLRDTSFPLINMFDAIDILFKHFNLTGVEKRDSDIPELSVQKQYLLTLREFQKNDNKNLP